MAWFTKSDLEDLAGSRSFARGQGYLTEVTNLRSVPNGVVATVQGTDSYRVRLYDTDGELDGECSCPYGEQGNFCKHCVAVGLRVLRGDGGVGLASGGVGLNSGGVGLGGGDQDVDVRAFVEALDRDELVELVWERVSDDPVLYQRLLLRAITASGAGNLMLLSEQIERLRVDFIEYGEEDAYADEADAVIEALAELVPDRAAEAQPLLRRTLTLVAEASTVTNDDCGAALASASDAWEVFVEACEAAPPDQRELGAWFAEFRRSASDALDLSISDLAELLGPAGLDVYWEALEAAHEEDPSNWTVRALREEMIKAIGDTDTLVAYYAEDLSSSSQYVKISKLLLAEERVPEAISWLELGRGVISSSDYGSAELVDLLSELYTKAGKLKEVADLRWDGFQVEKSVRMYEKLREAMLATDPQGWPQRREEALELLRSQAEDSKAWNAGTTYLRVLLAEDRDETAWEAMGRTQCDGATRMAVVGRRANTHPGEALDIYLPMIEQGVARANAVDYEQAADLLVTLKGVFQRAGRDFDQEVTRLKTAHSRKRNFVAALRQRGL